MKDKLGGNRNPFKNNIVMKVSQEEIEERIGMTSVRHSESSNSNKPMLIVIRNGKNENNQDGIDLKRKLRIIYLGILLVVYKNVFLFRLYWFNIQEVDQNFPLIDTIYNNYVQVSVSEIANVVGFLKGINLV